MTIDLNDAPQQQATLEQRVDHVKQALNFRARDFVGWLYPAAKFTKHEARIGNPDGDKGSSMWVGLEGADRGRWMDHATGEKGGDLISLYAVAENLHPRRDFRRILDGLEEWLGLMNLATGEAVGPYKSPPVPHKDPTERQKHREDAVHQQDPSDEPLGPPTGRWHYHDADGNIIATVNRYDHANGSKTYRPWDALRQRYKMPETRPLYNLQNILHSEPIVLVEGEKAADALISLGYNATTAMGGAHAPLNRTDWTALKGKRVIVWPDADDAGAKYQREVVPYLKQFNCAVETVTPPDDVKRGWDADDAVTEGRDVKAIIDNARTEKPSAIRTLRFDSIFNDNRPDEPDLIGPGLLGPAEILLIAGPPKSMKSMLLQDMLVSAALGRDFLSGSFKTAQPRSCYWLQAEMTYKLLKKRVKAEQFTDAELELLSKNLAISDRFSILLDENGEREVAEAITDTFENSPPDIIAFDPLANMFDGDSENDNAEMMRFLRSRIEGVRRRVSNRSAIALVHHANKASRDLMEKDPFNCIRGAGALRGYYTSGMVIYKPDEDSETRRLFFEFRSSAPPDPMMVRYDSGRMIADVEATRSFVDMIEIRRRAKVIYTEIDKAYRGPYPLSPHKQAGPRYALTFLANKLKEKPRHIHQTLEWMVSVEAISIGQRTSKTKSGYMPLDRSKMELSH